MKNLSKLILIYIFASILSYSDNLYEMYKTGEGYYQKKDYIKALSTVEKVLAQYPEYTAAKLLQFKIVYEMGDISSATSLIKPIIINSSDDSKSDLLRYLLNKNEPALGEEIYISISNKSDIDKEYIDFLYKNKKFRKITQLQSSHKDNYLDKIEAAKTKADKYFFAALSDLKKNNVSAGIKNLNYAIETYPENQIYYVKLGEIYADNKNFYLAEKNFRIALSFSEEKSIYEKLFSVYVETKNYERLHEVAKYISDIQYVRETMKRIDDQVSAKKRIAILKREGQKLYVERAFFSKNQIGDTFTLLKEKEVLKNEKTGESFDSIKESYGVVRVYDNLENVTLLTIVDEFKTINEKDEFFLY